MATKQHAETQIAGSPHGLPVKIETGDGEVRKVMFASARKHPKLLGMMKKISEAEADVDLAAAAFNLASRRLMRLETRIPSTDEMVADGAPTTAQLESEELAEAGKQYTAAQQRQDAADIARAKAMYDFFIEGLLGAGYTREVAEEYVQYFDAERYHMLRLNVLAGCGMTDFLPPSEQSRPLS